VKEAFRFLHRYPRYPPKRRLRKSPLPTILVDPHADLEQSRAVALHEPHLSFIARIRITQQESRMQLQILRRDVTRQQIEQPQMQAGWAIYRRFAQYRREFGRDCREYAPRGEHLQVRDALRGVRMHCY
jgi:hypothetical protein